MRVDFARDGLPGNDLSDLTSKLFNSLCARARNRLITGCEDALYAEGLVQRIESQERDRGGTIGISDNPLVQTYIVRVDLRNHQGGRIVHAKRAGVINHHTSGLGGDRSELA